MSEKTLHSATYCSAGFTIKCSTGPKFTAIFSISFAIQGWQKNNIFWATFHQLFKHDITVSYFFAFNALSFLNNLVYHNVFQPKYIKHHQNVIVNSPELWQMSTIVLYFKRSDLGRQNKGGCACLKCLKITQFWWLLMRFALLNIAICQNYAFTFIRWTKPKVNKV